MPRLFFPPAVAFLSLLVSLSALAESALDFSGQAIFRYQMDNNNLSIESRQRLLLIANLDADLTLSDNWTLHAQARTGQAELQNVSANVLYNFKDDTLLDGDLLLSQFYARAEFGDTALYLGKIPWLSQQNTSLFWDSHLNPYGAHMDYRLADNQQLAISYLKPLDGKEDSIGSMWVAQWQFSGELADGVEWQLAPWYVDYRGEQGARFARRDTTLDNQFVRVTGGIRLADWRVGADIGYSLADNSLQQSPEFSGQDTSYMFEVAHGALSDVGQMKLEARYFHVERFAVVSEFAHNSLAGGVTANYQGYDLRARRKMDNHWWLGLRYADTKQLIGDIESRRLRLETGFKF